MASFLFFASYTSGFLKRENYRHHIAITALPKEKDYPSKSLLASMFAGELVFGSEMTVIRALEEKCEIRSCSYLVDEALTS